MRSRHIIGWSTDDEAVALKGFTSQRLWPCVSLSEVFHIAAKTPCDYPSPFAANPRIAGPRCQLSRDCRASVEPVLYQPSHRREDTPQRCCAASERLSFS